MMPFSRRLWIRFGGRLMVAVWLVMALSPPRLPWSRVDLDLIVLVDESLSVPRGFIDSAWQEVLRLIDDAPANTHLRLIRFAASPVVETTYLDTASFVTEKLPRSTALDGTATNLASALLQALYLLPPDRSTVLLLLSDGIATVGDTESVLQSIHHAKVPLYLLAPRPDETSEAFILQDLLTPSSVSVGDRVPVRVQLTSTTGGIVVPTMKVDGQIVDQRELDLAPGEAASLSFSFTPREPGVNLVTVELAGGAAENKSNLHQVQSSAVNVLGQAPLMYVSARPESAPVARSLQLSGWKIIRTTPSQLTAHPASLQKVGSIVLDDLSVDDLSESVWRTLAKSVQDEGKGMAVLGGPHSFGAGAYRHSTLERILPVTAEAAEPQAPATVLFLLDKSGSMGREQMGPSNFALASQAVAASVNMLLPDDRLGIIAFAADAQTRLPIASRQANSGRVVQALDVTPGGGTQLVPALELAAEQLRAARTGQRLIVLVTDGFTGNEDLQPMVRMLRKEGVTVIALAVGDDANQEALQQLANFNGGSVLPVTNVATLPRLMTRSIARQRSPQVAQPTQTLLVRPLPFQMEPTALWPPLSSYMVTKPRPQAEVYLQSSRGDPLFATGLAGAGRVAVLPAGLGSWAEQWWQWPEFGAFLGGLSRWLSQGEGNAGLSLSVANNPGHLVLTVDLLDGNEWASQEQPSLLVDEPSGARTEIFPVLQAPGRYQIIFPATQPGLYNISLQSGQRTVRQAFYRNAAREFYHTALAQDRLKTWLDRGWVKPWAGVTSFLGAWPRDGSGLRQLLILLALLNYLLLLIYERDLAGRLAIRLRARFAKSQVKAPSAIK
jgi:Ca-activated chloride channel family protein